MRRIFITLLLLIACVCMAQSINLHPVKIRPTAVYGFGDSTIDSGWFKTEQSPRRLHGRRSLWRAAGHGASGERRQADNQPGAGFDRSLGIVFFLSAKPANQSGTNYAVSGARSVGSNQDDPKLFPNAIPTVKQIVNFLKAHHGAADPHAIYLVSAGNNDVAHAIDVTSDPQCPTDPTDCVRAAARGLAGAIARLHAAGAAAIIVPNLLKALARRRSRLTGRRSTPR